MSVLYLVVPLALAMVLVAVLAFIWAAKTGQFDDIETPGLRVLHDEAPARASAAMRTPTKFTSDKPQSPES